VNRYHREAPWVLDRSLSSYVVDRLPIVQVSPGLGAIDRRLARIQTASGCVDVDMSTEPDFEAIGLFEARYVAFLETITHLRPRLHRYCARMTGSVLDGEDVMQEAVFERPIIPWRMTLGEVDGETVVIILRDETDAVTPFSVIRLGVRGDRIMRSTDYIKCPWVLHAAGSIAVAGA
jgi:hypothetical protein